MITSPDPFVHFATPISAQAFEELTDLQAIMAQTHIVPETIDTRRFPWGSSSYTSAKFYDFMFQALPSFPSLNAIWKSKCLPKLKVFAWLLLMDRLNTKDLMLRKNWHIEDGISCVLCDSHTLETKDHLFFQCPFAARCWERIGIDWHNWPVLENFLRPRDGFAGPCYVEVVVCALWNIWKERNGLIFEHINHS
jgi:hypothetical protein